jgi:hypothetical protein
VGGWNSVGHYDEDDKDKPITSTCTSICGPQIINRNGTGFFFFFFFFFFYITIFNTFPFAGERAKPIKTKKPAAMTRIQQMTTPNGTWINHSQLIFILPRIKSMSHQHLIKKTYYHT